MARLYLSTRQGSDSYSCWLGCLHHAGAWYTGFHAAVRLAAQVGTLLVWVGEAVFVFMLLVSLVVRVQISCSTGKTCSG